MDADEVLALHHDATLDRITEHKVVLLIQDTTELDVTRREEKMRAAGPLNDESRIGFLTMRCWPSLQGYRLGCEIAERDAAILRDGVDANDHAVDRSAARAISDVVIGARHVVYVLRLGHRRPQNPAHRQCLPRQSGTAQA